MWVVLMMVLGSAPERPVQPSLVNPVSPAPDWVGSPLAEDDGFWGISVASAGDVNGDGYDDVIIGASGCNGSQGRADVYYGGATGLSHPDVPDWTADPTDQSESLFGFSVSTAGDVNGDGYDDVIIGAHYWGAGGNRDGRAYVYHGGPSGLSDGDSPDWTADPSNFPDGLFGCSVAAAGDIDADGYADVIVGAPGWTLVATAQGRAFVYAGSPTGLSSSPDWWAGPTDQANAYFGRAVSSAGDVNGDGFADIIIGAPKWGTDPAQEGRAYLYLGSATGPGDDRFPDWVANPTGQGLAHFGTSVTSAGDLNGDGYDDVAIGADGWDGDEATEGRIYVYFGGPAGPSPPGAADWVADPTDQSGAGFGHAVAGAGDTNGDGYAELVVSAWEWDGEADREGRAFAFSGSANGLLFPVMPDWVIDPTDQDGALFGYTLAGAGDVNGDGRADVIVGAYAWDGPHHTNQGQVSVFLGRSECGNGVVETGEACDDNDTDNCTADCAADCSGPFQECGGECPGLCDIRVRMAVDAPATLTASWGATGQPLLPIVVDEPVVTTRLDGLEVGIVGPAVFRAGRLYADSDQDGQVGSNDQFLAEVRPSNGAFRFDSLSVALPEETHLLLVGDVVFSAGWTGIGVWWWMAVGLTGLCLGRGLRVGTRRTAIAIGLLVTVSLAGCPTSPFSAHQSAEVSLTLSQAWVTVGQVVGLPVAGPMLSIR